jgi:serpin B
MLFAGARGTTRDEMAKALQYPESGKSIHSSLSLISGTVRELLRMSAEDRSGQSLGKAPLTISVANRLFAQKTTEFSPDFVALLDKTYRSSPGEVDFAGGPAGATGAINRWVAEQARWGIGEVVPPSALDSSTGLVVVSAIDLKMAWVNAFVPSGTMPFFLNANRIAEVAAFQVMANEAEYERRELYVAITVPVAAPYGGPDLQLIILLPHKGIELSEIEAMLSHSVLRRRRPYSRTSVWLTLPKLKMESALMPLAHLLSGLGMGLAFTQGADFGGISLRSSLHVKDVFHKASVEADEASEREIAAAAFSAQIFHGPHEVVDVDRPFFFAIQHRASGTCLFMGRVVDPR